MMPDCVFNEIGGQISPENREASHPFSYFRIMGIYLANPNVRAKIACPQPQPGFRSCQM